MYCIVGITFIRERDFMNAPVVIWGLGEIGGVFARGILKLGFPVYPVLRSTNIEAMTKAVVDPEAVIVAVGESDLQDVLAQIPEPWRDRLVLVQNELLPHDWKKHQISPTVISVWFEKKPGQDVKVIIPSPVYGDKASLISDALKAIHIPATIVADEAGLIKELVLKNLYILTVNIAGLALNGGVVETLWNGHEKLARDVAHDVLDIQFALIDTQLHREGLIEAMVDAFAGDWQHKCMGRSAPMRLKRAIQQANELGIEARTLKEIADKHAAA